MTEAGERPAYERADLLLEAGRAEDAIRLLTTHVAAHPEDSIALTLLGRAYLEARRPADALPPIDAALTMDPDNVVAWQRRSDALRQLGRFEEAKPAGRECVRLAPHSWAAHYTLGLAVHKLPGHRDELFGAARASVELAPDRADPHVLLGLAYAGVGDAHHAEQCYRRALSIDPEHAYARSNLSALHLRRGRFRAAMRGFQAAASSNPQETLFHRNIAATVVGSLVRHGYLLAVITVIVARFVIAAATGGSLDDPDTPDPTVHQGAWPLRIGLALLILAAWIVLCTVRLRPLTRYLRGHAATVLVDMLRTARFGLFFAGGVISQLCVLFALLEPGLSAGALNALATVAIMVLLFGNLGSRLASSAARRR